MPNTSSRQGNSPAPREIREGLLLCMFLSALMDEKKYPGLLQEIAIIATQEPEFSGIPEEFGKILELARKDLHKGPNELMRRIRMLLGSTDIRIRGLELAVRVVTSDGIVTRGQRALLGHLREQLGLEEEAMDSAIVAAQRRLVRFMMMYLVSLTALADGSARAEEFEEMLPFALSLPAFDGVSTAEYARVARSVRHHLEDMRGEKGVDYITATLRNAAELLDDTDIPIQALRLVARGVFADREIQESERTFFLQVAEKLGVDSATAESLIATPSE